MSHPPSKDPIDRLIDAMTQAGVPSDQKEREDLKHLFRRVPYSLIPSFPCPRYAGTSPFQPVPGQGMTYSFAPDVVPFNYTLVVIDVSVDPNVIVYQETIQFAAPPYEFSIPAAVGGSNTFVAGHDYVIVLYPSLRIGNVVVPFGCVSQVAKVATQATLKQAVFAALELPPAYPC